MQKQTIDPAQRLVIKLEYLATGDSQQSQSFNFIVAKKHGLQIIGKTCSAIWRAPQTTEEWEKIANSFEEEREFPCCLGALDGKHIANECPIGVSSLYCKFKKFHSIVLMALCGAKYLI